MANHTDWNDGVPPADMKDPVWVLGQWYERGEQWPTDGPNTVKPPQTGNLFE